MITSSATTGSKKHGRYVTYAVFLVPSYIGHYLCTVTVGLQAAFQNFPVSALISEPTVTLYRPDPESNHLIRTDYATLNPSTKIPQKKAAAVFKSSTSRQNKTVI